MSDGPGAEPAGGEDLWQRGTRLLQSGATEQARAVLDAAALARPGEGRLLHDLAIARQQCGDRAGALAALRQALSGPGPDVELLRALADRFAALGAAAEAAVALRRVLDLHPGDPVLWHRYGRALERTAGSGDPGAAAAGSAYRRALALDSSRAGAWKDLGSLLYRQGMLQAATACWRCAVKAEPGLTNARLSLAIACRDQGRLPAARQLLAQAAADAPQRRDLQIQQIFTLDFDPAQDSASQQRARRTWAAAVLPPDAAASVRHRLPPPAPDPERRLRIGYVSSDFNQHSAATTFAAPILHHDPSRFHLTCYSMRDWNDAMTDRFRAAAAAWRDMPGVTEAALAQQVRDDRIDILVDLSGHSPGHRLGAFALCPAPLQVTGWGHCTGTGMPQMDALLADPVIVPPAERPLFAETVVDLPCALGYLPFEAMPEAEPAEGLLAHRRATPLTAPVVFGALGRGGKLGSQAVQLWSQVMHAVSDSRLHLKDHQYRCRGQRRDVALQFAARGIDPARLSFAEGTDWRGHMQAYWKVDIALDTLPHGGGVTTLEALMMGVPVISLCGRFPSARIGAAILTACGLGSCVAQEPKAFVAIAEHLAAGVAGLRSGRAALRDKLRGRAPYDAPAYARAVEAAYRRLWQARCAGLPPAAT